MSRKRKKSVSADQPPAQSAAAAGESAAQPADPAPLAPAQTLDESAPVEILSAEPEDRGGAMVASPRDQEDIEPDDEPGRRRKAPLKQMTLGEHLEELRTRLIYAVVGLMLAMGVGLYFGKDVVVFFEQPYFKVMTEMGKEPHLVVTRVGEGFAIYMRVSFYVGLILASWWILYQMWMFIASGLYPSERRYVQISVPISVVLFITGAAFFYYYVSLPALRFFLMFDDIVGVEPMITIREYIHFITSMMFVMGLVFQMPLVVLVLARIGVANLKTFNRYRRHVIVGIAAFSAVFAPADPFSMLAMSVPMWLLYEIGVGFSWLLIFRKQKKQPEEDPDQAAD